jgi:hypothetical protein
VAPERRLEGVLGSNAPSSFGGGFHGGGFGDQNDWSDPVTLMEKVVMSRAITNIHLRVAALAVLTFLSACAGGGAPAGPTFAQVAAQIPAVPADRARIYFYRAYEPYESVARPDITLNGKVAGVSEPGGVFYRDVPPGDRVAVSHDTFYPDEDKTLSLAAGSTAFVKIESIRGYDGGNHTYDPDTFVVAVVDSTDGQRDIASKRYFANGA